MALSSVTAPSGSDVRRHGRVVLDHFPLLVSSQRLTAEIRVVRVQRLFRFLGLLGCGLRQAVLRMVSYLILRRKNQTQDSCMPITHLDESADVFER